MSEDGPLQLRHLLPADDDAPGAARTLAADLLGRRHARAEDLALVISELVTNAVVHAPPGDVDFALIATSSMIRVEVADGGVEPFAWPTTKPDGHRGLAIIDLCSERAGVLRTPQTLAWCELDLPPANGR